MSPRGIALGLWLGAGASALGWSALGLASPGRPAMQPPALAAPAPGASWERVLGHPDPAAATPSPAIAATPEMPMQLLGVVAGRQHSLALIAVDGKPPRVVPLGGALPGGLVLARVTLGGVVLEAKGGGPGKVLALAGSGHAAPQLPGKPVLRLGEEGQDASPIVPPHEEMQAPPARQAGTPGSEWSRMRANPGHAAPPEDASAAPPQDQAPPS